MILYSKSYFIKTISTRVIHK